jgi:hypothetical protein
VSFWDFNILAKVILFCCPARESLVASGLILHYNKNMSVNPTFREITEAIALIDAAIRKIKMPPEELKRAKNKLVEFLKKRVG